MERLRLFKYPGAKNSLLQPLTELFRRSGCNTFVDLFGGSGYVSLNIPSERVVFNDINPEICMVFNTIRNKPDQIQREFREALDTGLFRRSTVQEAELNFRRWGSRRGMDPDVFATLITILRNTVSFGGLGNTYSTKEKSSTPYARKTLEMFPAIAKKVSGWVIENSDFQEVIRKYDSDSVFFYLDPPYGTKRWYRDSFSHDDYIRMRESIEKIKGRYVMNFDYNDVKLLEIFGEPDFVYEVEDQNQNPVTGKRPKRRYYFSTNFKH